MTNHSVDAKSNTPVAGTTTVDEALDHAKRAFALKKYEQAVDHYATALELMYVTLICRDYKELDSSHLVQDGQGRRRCPRSC